MQTVFTQIKDLLTTISGTLTSVFTDMALASKQYIMRASEKAGRTYINISGSITANGSIYTVTGGKKLYVCSMISSFVHTDAVNPYFTVRDGGVAGTVLLTSSMAANSAQSVVAANTSLNVEPIQATTSLYIKSEAGVYGRISYNVVGYEE